MKMIEKLDIRRKRELEILNSLTEKQWKAIETVCQLLLEKDSIWLIGLFKYISSAKSEKLAAMYAEPEIAFELQSKASISEIWREGAKKVYKTVSKVLPERFKSLFAPFYKIRQEIRASKN